MTQGKGLPSTQTGRDHGKEEHILILPQNFNRVKKRILQFNRVKKEFEKFLTSLTGDETKKVYPALKLEEIMEKKIYPHTTATLQTVCFSHGGNKDLEASQRKETGDTFR